MTLRFAASNAERLGLQSDETSNSVVGGLFIKMPAKVNWSDSIVIKNEVRSHTPPHGERVLAIAACSAH